MSTVLLGVRTLEQLKENLDAIGVLTRLDQPTIQRIEAILGNKPVPKVYFNRV